MNSMNSTSSSSSSPCTPSSTIMDNYYCQPTTPRPLKRKMILSMVDHEDKNIIYVPASDCHHTVHIADIPHLPFFPTRIDDNDVPKLISRISLKKSASTTASSSGFLMHPPQDGSRPAVRQRGDESRKNFLARCA